MCNRRRWSPRCRCNRRGTWRWRWSWLLSLAFGRGAAEEHPAENVGNPVRSLFAREEIAEVFARDRRLRRRQAEDRPGRVEDIPAEFVRKVLFFLRRRFEALQESAREIVESPEHWGPAGVCIGSGFKVSFPQVGYLTVDGNASRNRPEPFVGDPPPGRQFLLLVVRPARPTAGGERGKDGGKPRDKRGAHQSIGGVLPALLAQIRSDRPQTAVLRYYGRHEHREEAHHA